MDMEEECDCVEGAPAWMATFSDLATLLLTFFILLLSFSNMDVVHFREMLGSVKDAFGVQHAEPGNLEAIASSPVQMSKSTSTLQIQITQGRQARLMRALARYAKDQGLEGEVQVTRGKRGVVFRVMDTIFFASGSATLKKTSFDILDKIGELANQSETNLAIEGHTDDRPIHTRRFPSNWELSSSRAIATMRRLTRSHKLSRERVSVAGYADTRPLVANKSSEKRAKNRRVEFVFIDPPPAKQEIKPNLKPIRPPSVFPLPFASN